MKLIKFPIFSGKEVSLLTYKYNSLSTVYDMMLFLENYNIKYFFINGIHSFDRLLAMNKDHYFYNFPYLL